MRCILYTVIFTALSGLSSHSLSFAIVPASIAWALSNLALCLKLSAHLAASQSSLVREAASALPGWLSSALVATGSEFLGPHELLVSSVTYLHGYVTLSGLQKLALGHTMLQDECVPHLQFAREVLTLGLRM
jgi:hypothetical protein